LYLSNISVAAAQAAIDKHIQPLAIISRSLRELAGSVLAETICMERDQPPFDRVAMDGIAVSAIALSTHSNHGRADGLLITGTQAAGTAPLALPSPLHCIEVMTGAHLPANCDCVIPVEKIHIESGKAFVNDDANIEPWANIHRRGSDAHQGDEILKPGCCLRSVDVAVIASAGYQQTKVHATPRIAVISTGDELVEPGLPIHDWQIRRSNSYALLSVLNKYGFTQMNDLHLRDQPDELRAQLSSTLEQHDVLILSGGVSAGRFDFIPQVLNDVGVRTIFHKISQRPGRPMWFGVRDDGKAVFALPGNPVSVLVCMYRYVLRGLYRAMGMMPPLPASAKLVGNFVAHPTLTTFVPVTLEKRTATIKARRQTLNGSGDLMSLLATDGFVELPASTLPINSNTNVPLYCW